MVWLQPADTCCAVGNAVPERNAIATAVAWPLGSRHITRKDKNLCVYMDFFGNAQSRMLSHPGLLAIEKAPKCRRHCEP